TAVRGETSHPTGRKRCSTERRSDGLGLRAGPIGRSQNRSGWESVRWFGRSSRIPKVRSCHTERECYSHSDISGIYRPLDWQKQATGTFKGIAVIGPTVKPKVIRCQKSADEPAIHNCPLPHHRQARRAAASGKPREPHREPALDTNPVRAFRL